MTPVTSLNYPCCKVYAHERHLITLLTNAGTAVTVVCPGWCKP